MVIYSSYMSTFPYVLKVIANEICLTGWNVSCRPVDNESLVNHPALSKNHGENMTMLEKGAQCDLNLHVCNRNCDFG